MKRTLTGAILLLLCFAVLAIPSGAIPSVPEAAASALPAAPSDSPAPARSPEPSAAPAPSPEPSDWYEPSAAPAPAPEITAADGTRILATTITSDDLLDNDTYYNIDPDALLAEEPSLTLPQEGYQILIIHTHGTEAYAQDPAEPYEECGAYHTLDPAYSVIRVGEELADALGAYGLNVLHCTTLFDYPSYNGSYARSGEAIEEYLSAYPGIHMVIDLHRDAIGDGDKIYKTMANIDGEYAAQLLFVMGSDVNLPHPDWEENLRLALILQQAANTRFGTLMRPLNLCNYRYNQQLTEGSLLLEVGTSGNTLEEALCAVRLFAETAGPILASCAGE